MITIYIWRDALDPNMFSFGVLRNDRISYTAWGNCFVDGLSECFGTDVSEEVQAAPVGKPVAVKLGRISLL